MRSVRPFAFVFKVIFKRLVKHLVAAGRGVVAGEVPVADGGLAVGSW